MKLRDFDILIRDVLKIDDFSKADIAANGLQVGDYDAEVKKIAFAVDACQASFKLAIDWGADVLFTHHGLMWGREQRLVGNHYKRIQTLVENRLALYSVHLPLDAHPQFGNNAGLAKLLGLQNIQPFGFYKGVKIGFSGELAEPMDLSKVEAVLFSGGAEGIRTLRMNERPVKKVAVVSGGATRESAEAIAMDMDLYITGDASHEIYHPLMEAGVNCIFGGHYYTEIWGVKSMAEALAGAIEGYDDFKGLETRFFDIPTGL